MGANKTESSDEEGQRRRQLKRRGLIAGTAFLSAALMAKMSSRDVAATDGVALVTGQDNSSLGETRITRSGSAAVNGFTVSMASTVGAAAIAAQGTGSTVGVVAQSTNQVGMFGISSTNIAVLGSSTSGISIFGNGTANVGVYGQSASSVGVYGTSANGTAVYGLSAPNVGVYGQSVNNLGVYGNSQNAPGVRGDSSNNYGVVGFSGGVIGVLGQTISGIGVYGISPSGTAGRFDGAVVVNGDFSATGMKSAVVVASDGVQRRLYCMESPDSWFEDMGEAELHDGSVGVRIDSVFASVVDLAAGYLVFLTPYGDCNGLYVADRSDQGFLVRELRNGNSSLRFSFRVLARRRDIEAPRLERSNIERQLSPAKAPRINAAPATPNVPEPPRIPTNLVR